MALWYCTFYILLIINMNFICQRHKKSKHYHILVLLMIVSDNFLLDLKKKELSRDSTAAENGMEVLLHLLTSINHEWTQSDKLISELGPILLRLCARCVFYYPCHLSFRFNEKRWPKGVRNIHVAGVTVVSSVNLW